MTTKQRRMLLAGLLGFSVTLFLCWLAGIDFDQRGMVPALAIFFAMTFGGLFASTQSIE